MRARGKLGAMAGDRAGMRRQPERQGRFRGRPVMFLTVLCAALAASGGGLRAQEGASRSTPGYGVVPSLPVRESHLPRTPPLTPENYARPEARAIPLDRPAPAYHPPGLDTLTQAMIRLSGRDLNIDAVVDEYMLLAHCSLFERHFTNEFEWRKIRAAARRSVSLKRDSFPLHYRYVAPVLLGRYDFDLARFHLARAEAFQDVTGVWLVRMPGQLCERVGELRYFPMRYRVGFLNRLQLSSLPIGESEGHALLARMEHDGNTDRRVWVAIDMELASYKPPIQLGTGRDIGNFLGWVDRVTVFEDSAMTRPLHTFVPERVEHFRHSYSLTAGN